jgi:hypothetical protein
MKPKFWSHLLKVLKAKPKVNKVLQNVTKTLSYTTEISQNVISFMKSC